MAVRGLHVLPPDHRLPLLYPGRVRLRRCRPGDVSGGPGEGETLHVPHEERRHAADILEHAPQVRHACHVFHGHMYVMYMFKHVTMSKYILFYIFH